jgi:hypothetical protein
MRDWAQENAMSDESVGEALSVNNEVVMDSSISLSLLIRRLIGFAVAGFAVIVLAGPLLTIAAMIGMCVLIGFVLWLPLHTVFVGPQSTWKNACDGGRRWRHRALGCCGIVGRQCRSVGVGATSLVAACWPVVSGTVREGACGAISGGLVVMVAGLKGPAAAAAVLTGGALGVLVGLHHAANGGQ